MRLKVRYIVRTYQICLFLLLLLLPQGAFAQEENVSGGDIPLARSHREKQLMVLKDTLALDTTFLEQTSLEDKMDSISKVDKYAKMLSSHVDSLTSFSLNADSLKYVLDSQKNGRFVPDSKKALWLAIVFPGGGQIYNRKYWKLPIIYGGFIGCVYAMTWNNTMYRDYSQAYIDIMDSDPNTKSYESFIPAHYDVNANQQRLQDLFKRKKNYYRRFRDLSMFCMIGVYALSIIDAYVDAEMSSFDISHDLTMKVHPTVINDKYSALRASGINSSSYGVQCSLNF